MKLGIATQADADMFMAGEHANYEKTYKMLLATLFRGALLTLQMPYLYGLTYNKGCC